jgi:hypothetical protein
LRGLPKRPGDSVGWGKDVRGCHAAWLKGTRVGGSGGEDAELRYLEMCTRNFKHQRSGHTFVPRHNSSNLRDRTQHDICFFRFTPLSCIRNLLAPPCPLLDFTTSISMCPSFGASPPLPHAPWLVSSCRSFFLYIW